MESERNRLELNGNRLLSISFPSSPVLCDVPPPFVALLPSYLLPEQRQLEAIVKGLIGVGCVEICSTGPFAEAMHDMMDETLESNGAVEIVTTWIEDPLEASEYFIHAAAGGRANLLALVRANPELEELVHEQIGLMARDKVLKGR